MESFPKFENKSRKAFESYMKLFHLTSEDVKKPLLDVGAGTGGFIHYLRHELGNSHAYGVENQAWKINPQEDGMVVADGFNLPFPDELFELVLTKNYLPMFVEDENKMKKALLELLRVTMPGGKVIGDISTPEGVVQSLKNHRNLEEYDQGIVNWLKERHKGAQKLSLFLDELQEKGIEVQREGDIVTIYKK